MHTKKEMNLAACGLWSADRLTEKIWDDVNRLIDQHGSSLDIIYNDLEFNADSKRQYKRLIFCNETSN